MTEKSDFVRVTNRIFHLLWLLVLCTVCTAHVSRWSEKKPLQRSKLKILHQQECAVVESLHVILRMIGTVSFSWLYNCFPLFCEWLFPKVDDAYLKVTSLPSENLMLASQGSRLQKAQNTKKIIKREKSVKILVYLQNMKKTVLHHFILVVFLRKIQKKYKK